MKAASKCVVKGLWGARRNGIVTNNTFRVRCIASAKKQSRSSAIFRIRCISRATGRILAPCIRYVQSCSRIDTVAAPRAEANIRTSAPSGCYFLCNAGGYIPHVPSTPSKPPQPRGFYSPALPQLQAASYTRFVLIAIAVQMHTEKRSGASCSPHYCHTLQPTVCQILLRHPQLPQPTPPTMLRRVLRCLTSAISSSIPMATMRKRKRLIYTHTFVLLSETMGPAPS